MLAAILGEIDAHDRQRTLVMPFCALAQTMVE
jgi:hypothetical protein